MVLSGLGLRVHCLEFREAKHRPLSTPSFPYDLEIPRATLRAQRHHTAKKDDAGSYAVDAIFYNGCKDLVLVANTFLLI